MQALNIFWRNMRVWFERCKSILFDMYEGPVALYSDILFSIFLISSVVIGSVNKLYHFSCIRLEGIQSFFHSSWRSRLGGLYCVQFLKCVLTQFLISLGLVIILSGVIILLKMIGCIFLLRILSIICVVLSVKFVCLVWIYLLICSLCVQSFSILQAM